MKKPTPERLELWKTYNLRWHELNDQEKQTERYTDEWRSVIMKKGRVHSAIMDLWSISMTRADLFIAGELDPQQLWESK